MKKDYYKVLKANGKIYLDELQTLYKQALINVEKVSYANIIENFNDLININEAYLVLSDMDLRIAYDRIMCQEGCDKLNIQLEDLKELASNNDLHTSMVAYEKYNKFYATYTKKESELFMAWLYQYARSFVEHIKGDMVPSREIHQWLFDKLGQQWHMIIQREELRFNIFNKDEWQKVIASNWNH